MNQKEILNSLKTYIHEYPEFLKSLKNPLAFIDENQNFDYLKLFLFGFLTEALTQVLYSIATGNFSLIFSGLIFIPIQVLIVLSFIAFVVWFALDKMGYTQIQFFDLLKPILFIEMIVSLGVLPILILGHYLNSLNAFYILQILVYILKGYLFFRVLSNQFKIDFKKSVLISSILCFIITLPQISSFIEVSSQLRNSEKALYDEKTMEESLKALEKEFGVTE